VTSPATACFIANPMSCANGGRVRSLIYTSPTDELPPDNGWLNAVQLYSSWLGQTSLQLSSTDSIPSLREFLAALRRPAKAANNVQFNSCSYFTTSAIGATGTSPVSVAQEKGLLVSIANGARATGWFEALAADLAGHVKDLDLVLAGAAHIANASNSAAHELVQQVIQALQCVAARLLATLTVLWAIRLLSQSLSLAPIVFALSQRERILAFVILVGTPPPSPCKSALARRHSCGFQRAFNRGRYEAVRRSNHCGCRTVGRRPWRASKGRRGRSLEIESVGGSI
jgi:hypothetical protein